MSSSPRTLSAVLFLALVAGCDTTDVFHEPTPSLHRMVVQPRADPYEHNPVFPDGKVMRRPPRGTVPTGTELERGAVRSRVLFLEQQDGVEVSGVPFPVSQAVLEEGRERYMVFCAVCHGVAGYASSYVANRMELVRPASLHSDRLRGMPPQYFYDVIAQGYGAMPSYANQLGERERWAVAAFVQALQLSQNARGELPARDRAQPGGAQRQGAQRDGAAEPRSGSDIGEADRRAR